MSSIKRHCSAGVRRGGDFQIVQREFLDCKELTHALFQYKSAVGQGIFCERVRTVILLARL
jgi:hypothetical protein